MEESLERRNKIETVIREEVDHLKSERGRGLVAWWLFTLARPPFSQG